MKYLALCAIAALASTAKAFGTKGRLHGHHSTSMQNEHTESNVYALSTNNFIGNFASEASEIVMGLAEEDNAKALLDEPLKFFYGPKGDSSEADMSNEKNFQKTVAECLLTHEEDSVTKTKTVYLSLKDAEAYGKRIEDAKNKGEFGNEVHQNVRRHVQLTCKPVVIEDESKRCAMCLYSEILIPNKHIRYGHLGNTSVLECLNGYDNDLDKSSTARRYYINSADRYHPLCIA
ncbi:uncharacterized protein BXIN_0118 [Babesia sp. Xinjiang]|uniref:uncharacterized protein n=1 Tax=Babesia sp. Xinjiang TaxID=462227 RepID=UPI000A247056|nr:uncharacterized protein BXIN_0118 [Babesia sp. Xinjiang]ORM39672.1 hypothetical protein BXIN_0118 [Babesia sp. Xinjiang]